MLTYRPYLAGIVYILLISQLWVNTVTYCHWMTDSKSELIQLFGSEEGESEGEIDKKEKDDTFRIDLSNLNHHESASTLLAFHPERHHFADLLEIVTPPPESHLF